GLPRVPKPLYSCPLRFRVSGNPPRRRGGMADAEDLKSSPGEPGCGFESHRRHSRQDRTDPVKRRSTPGFPGNSPGSTSDKPIPRSRQNQSTSVQSRHKRATEGATGTITDDAELAAVIEAWPNLSQAVRASIIKLARTSAKGGGP